MSFSASLGDIIATRQICKTLIATGDATISSPRANQAFKQLNILLSDLTSILTHIQTRTELARKPLEDQLKEGLSRVRRDVQAFTEASQKQTLHTSKIANVDSTKKEIEACIDCVSKDARLLEALIGQVFSARDTTPNEEVLLPTTASLEANSSEDNRIRQWLTGWHNEDVHARLVGIRYEHTGSWILENTEFQIWKNSPASFLWLSGRPGSGKSVLSAYIVESLRLDDARSPRVAFYHFSYQDLYTSSLERCLLSILGQLTSKEPEVPAVIRELYYHHAGGTTLPSIQALQEVMFLAVSIQSSCYVVLDAIDECSELEEALGVFNALRRYGTQNPQSLRILITSRNDYEIDAALTKIFPGEYAVSIQLETTVNGREDITRYIEHRLDRLKFSLELKKEIPALLLENSQGMFLWTKLALDQILAPRTVKGATKALYQLPGDLHDSYQQMLLKIPSEDYEMMRRIFIWIMNSARPLTVDEMGDAIALNTAGEIVSPADRLIDPDAILETCSGFLFQDPEVKTLKLGHATMLDFLQSKHTVGPLMTFQHSDGDRILADCCVTYLLMFSEEDSLLDRDLSNFSLLAYAAQYWPHHARRAQDAQSWHPKTTQLIMRLFQENNGTTFSNWLKIFGPATLEAPEEKIFTRSSPLFYASFLGLRHIAEWLTELEEKIPTSELEFSLYAASLNGHTEIVSLLLDRGANPNTESWSGGRSLDFAILKRHTSVVELLLDRSVDVTYKDGILGNPFQTAVSTGDAALVNLVVRRTKTTMAPEAFLELLSQGIRDAARNGNVEVVQFLFNFDERGDLDASDEIGWTALHYAIRHKHDNVQQYLIDHGADIDKRNFDDETPADFAWSDRRLDLSLYNSVEDLKKETKQAFSCHVLRQVSDSGYCQSPIFRKTFKFKGKNRLTKPKAKKAIVREHTILQKIEHPFIVSYLWYEEDKKQEIAHLHLEYCDGGDLDVYSARAIVTGEEGSGSDDSDQSAPSCPYLTPKELWRYMFQVAAALAYLHHGLSLRPDQRFTLEKQWTQILHRDIKPSNIVLNNPQSGPPEAKICDLGLAKGLGPKIKEAKETGGIGTRNYWPPEMFHKDGFWTAKGDIYSYGSTFSDLRTKSATSSSDCHSSEEIFAKCMAYQPADRPSSLELLEMTRIHVIEEFPLCTSNLHGLLGQSHAGYLHDAFYKIAGELDTKVGFDNRSVRVRRQTLIKRLQLLCDDGAGSMFDAQPGPPDMRLPIAVLLDRENAFNQALETLQAISNRWPDSGWTPLHLAAQENNVGMYTRLLTANADPLVRDEQGRVASSYLPQTEPGMLLE